MPLICFLIILALPLQPQTPPAAPPLPSHAEMQRFWDTARYEFHNWGLPRHPPPAFDPAPDSDNAAARYLWLFERMDQRLSLLAGWLDSDATRFAIAENTDGLTTDELRRALIDAQPWILSLIEATRLPKYATGLSGDPLAVMAFDDPRRNISPRRRAARILLADALRLWHENQPVESAERFAACIRFARHLSSPPASAMDALIAQYIIHSTALYCVRILLDLPQRERMTPEAAALILRSLEDIDARDPCGVRRAFNDYRHAMEAFAEAQLAGGRVGFRLKLALSQSLAIQRTTSRLFDGLISGREPGLAMRDAFRMRLAEAFGIAAEIEELSHAELVDALANARNLGDEADRAWDQPDAIDLLRRLDARIEQDQTGLAGLIMIGLRAGYRSTRDAAERLADLKATLSAIADPPQQPKAGP